jgi:hypothetical protein
MTVTHRDPYTEQSSLRRNDRTALIQEHHRPALARLSSSGRRGRSRRAGSSRCRRERSSAPSGCGRPARAPLVSLAYSLWTAARALRKIRYQAVWYGGTRLHERLRGHDARRDVHGLVPEEVVDPERPAGEALNVLAHAKACVAFLT